MRTPRTIPISEGIQFAFTKADHERLCKIARARGYFRLSVLLAVTLRKTLGVGHLGGWEVPRERLESSPSGMTLTLLCPPAILDAMRTHYEVTTKPPAELSGGILKQLLTPPGGSAQAPTLFDDAKET